MTPRAGAACCEASGRPAYTASWLSLRISSVRNRPAAFLSRPMVGLAVCLAVLLVVGAVLWRQLGGAPAAIDVSEQRTTDSITDGTKRAASNDLSSSTPDSADQKSPRDTRRPRQELAANVTVKIDFDERPDLREASNLSDEATRTTSLPQSRTRLLLELPRGSSKGAYIVSIVDPFAKPLLVTRRISSNGRRLTALLDLRAVQPGKYRLCIRRAGEGEVPDCHPLVISDSRRAQRQAR